MKYGRGENIMHLLKIEFERNIKIEIISERDETVRKTSIEKGRCDSGKRKRKKGHGANLRKIEKIKVWKSISFCNVAFRIL